MGLESRQLTEATHNTIFDAGLLKASLASPPRVVMDARKITDGGIGTFIQNCVRAFLSLGADLALLGDPQKIASFDFASRVSVIKDFTPLYSLREYFSLARRINSLDQYRLFFSPHYTLPFGLKVPSVITVHDLIQVKYPESWYYPYVAKALILSAIKRASTVICVSEATRNSITDLVGNNSPLRSKFVVVRNIAKQFDKSENSIRSEVLASIGSGDYFLSVFSTLKPHKGLGDLLRAYQSCRDRLRRLTKSVVPPKLVLVGQGFNSSLELADLDARLLEGVICLKRVSEAELKNLYTRAKALVVASRDEGSCLPVLEAHACGLPVITRPIPAVLEAIGPGDLPVVDFTIESLADGLFNSSTSAVWSERRALVRNTDDIHGLAKALLSLYTRCVPKPIVGGGVCE